MIGKTETKKQEWEAPTSYICDYCKKEIKVSDWQELQEMQSINFVGGYGSVFGDGIRVQVDICQDCFKEHVGPYVKLYDPDTNEEIENELQA